MGAELHSQDLTLEQLLVNTSLVEVITNKIRDNIHSGKYAPGQKLIVRELSDELGVSQTPIKEALHYLLAEGYIQTMPRKSMVVRRITYEEYEQSMEMRVMMELYAVPTVIAAGAHNQIFLQKMKQDLENMDAVLAEKDALDTSEWLKYDGQFHGRYMSALGNETLLSSYTGLNVNRFSYLAFLDREKHPLTWEHFQLDQADHIEIYDAIAAGDTERLTQAIAAHILRPRTDVDLNSGVRKRVEQALRLYQST